jgi:hypothetical protein
MTRMKNIKSHKTLSLQVFKLRLEKAVKFGAIGIYTGDLFKTRDLKAFVKQHKNLVWVDNEQVKII